MASFRDFVPRALQEFYGGVCQYCGSKEGRICEHIVPSSKGGSDALENITLACHPCNSRKAAIEFDPMCLAIAHARAALNAPAIKEMALRMADKISGPIMPTMPRTRGRGPAKGNTPQFNIRVPDEIHEPLREIAMYLRADPDKATKLLSVCREFMKNADEALAADSDGSADSQNAARLDQIEQRLDRIEAWLTSGGMRRTPSGTTAPGGSGVRVGLLPKAVRG